jgi:hypothetical protein
VLGLKYKAVRSPTVIRRMDADDKLGVHSRTNQGGLYRRGDLAIWSRRLNHRSDR